jgi:hypothetical protein
MLLSALVPKCYVIETITEHIFPCPVMQRKQIAELSGWLAKLPICRYLRVVSVTDRGEPVWKETTGRVGSYSAKWKVNLLAVGRKIIVSRGAKIGANCIFRSGWMLNKHGFAT